jgi:hypothetical protein
VDGGGAGVGGEGGLKGEPGGAASWVTSCGQHCPSIAMIYLPIMAGTFTWERGPFEQCPRCAQQTFGFLSAGGHEMTLRCTSCRHSQSILLPILDKAAIYLDQFVFSVIYKLKIGGRPPPGHEYFYDELAPILRRIVFLQQVILPHSDIHLDETIVFRDATALREAYEGIGGDVSLTANATVEEAQVLAYAQAFRDGTEPALNLVPDEVLESDRNDWLPNLRVAVNINYSSFADGIRQQRGRSFAEFERLTVAWAAEKPSFNELLRRELNIGRQRRDAFEPVVERWLRAKASGDWSELNEAWTTPVLEEVFRLSQFFQPDDPHQMGMRRVGQFWDWPRFREMPIYRISAYLFAAMGRRAANGQKKFTAGLFNDVRAIATYAPYVDAMFLDLECARLAKSRSTKELNLLNRL